MATLEELVVSLVAETSGLRAELDKAAKATEKATSKMDDAIKQFSDNSTKNTSMFETAMGTMAGFLGSQAVLGAFNKVKEAASFLFNTFVVEGVAAAQVQQDAMNRLNSALALTGQYSKQTSKDMVDFASALQSTSLYGDEVILNNAALIQSLGGLEKEGLQRATKAAVDMSAALGIDLRSAATLVGKAAAGEVSSFTRYGVVIEKGADQAKTLENALTALEKKFGGAAAAQVNTFSGLITQMKNVFGDIQEEIGFAIVKNVAFVNVLGVVSSKLLGVNKDLADNGQAYREFAAQALLMVINTVRHLVNALDFLGRTFMVIKGIIQVLAAPLNVIIAGFLALTSGVDTAKDYMLAAVNEIKTNFSAFGDETQTSLGSVSDVLADMAIAAEMGLDEVRAGVEATIEPTNNAEAAVKSLAQTEQQRLDGLAKLKAAMEEGARFTQEMYGLELEELQLNLEEKSLLEDEYYALKLEKMMARQAEEQALLENQKNAGLITEQQYRDQKLLLEKKQDLESRKLSKDKAKFDEAMQGEQLKQMSSTLNGLAALSQSSNKKLANAGKAFAISDATVKAYMAIQNALATVPYPANIAAAAGIGAQAFMNVSRIAGINLNKGGTVPGGGPNVDRVPAMLTSGEEVVNRDTADKLRTFLDNNSGGSARIELTMSDNFMDMIEAKIIERRNIGISLLGTV